MEVESPDGGGEQSSLRSPRFTHWMAFLILSTVTMGSTIEAVSLYRLCFNNGFHFLIPSFYLSTIIISHKYIFKYKCNIIRSLLSFLLILSRGRIKMMH